MPFFKYSLGLDKLDVLDILDQIDRFNLDSKRGSSISDKQSLTFISL